jgi:hypothetical protein
MKDVTFAILDCITLVLQIYSIQENTTLSNVSKDNMVLWLGSY